MSEGKHALLPWRWTKCPCGHVGCHSYDVGPRDSRGGYDHEDAVFIVKAVNSHDQLVEAGKRLADQAKYCYTPDPTVKLFKEGAEYRSLKRRTDSLKGFVSAFDDALKVAGEDKEV